MNASLNWLTDFVEIEMSAKALAERLTAVGTVCDGIEETATDVVFDLDVTSNRADLLGHVGIAREISAATGAVFLLKDPRPAESAEQASKLTSVEVRDPDLCPRYTARVIRGVKIGPSPSWMVERLEAVGLRSINNVVDVTNYVMMEYGQPLHAFDFDALGGRRIVVRRARDGESLVSIDQTRCELRSSMLVIADADKPVAVAGVMGGIQSEVSPSTTAVLLEAAEFDPLCIRRTSRGLSLMSPSNYRFERGVDPVGVETASRRACELILQLAGGQLAKGVVDVWAQPYKQIDVTLRPERTKKILGIDIPLDRQVQTLARLGMAPRSKDGVIVCAIPPYRRDLRREIDLIEEIARLVGYDEIPTGGRISHAVTSQGLLERTRQIARRTLAAAGFDESVSPSFIDEIEARLLGWERTIHADTLVRRTNNTLRPTILPALLRAAKTNQDAGCDDVSLFELAAVFPAGPQHLPDERTDIAMMSTGQLRDLRGAVEALVAAVDPEAAIQSRPKDSAGLAEGAAAELVMDGKAIGRIGVIAPAVQDHYGLAKPVVVAEVRFDALVARAGRTRRYEPISRTPAVTRDLSVIVDEAVTWQQIIEAIESVAQTLRTAVDFVTIYRGKPIPDGRKSVTLTLTYHDPAATLRSEQVDEQVAAVVSAVSAKLAAQLRQ